MVTVSVAPYTLTNFGSVPDGTVFVNAGEYAHTQDELPLGLDWEEVYRQIINPTPKQAWLYADLGSSYDSLAQAVKYDGWGYYLNARGASSHYPSDPIITGPPLRKLPVFGCELDEEEEVVLHHLQGLQPRWSMLSSFAPELPRRRSFGAKRALISILKRLDQAGLVQLAPDRVSLSNLGLLRSLQDLDRESHA